jgi:hypothetical protein
MVNPATNPLHHSTQKLKAIALIDDSAIAFSIFVSRRNNATSRQPCEFHSLGLEI